MFGGGAGRRTHATTAHAAPVHHHQRRPSMKDKVSGALLKLKGSLTRRPGVKVCSYTPLLSTSLNFQY